MDPKDILDSFNLYDPRLPEVEHEVFEYAREHCPVAHTAEQGGYRLVTRYADVNAVLLDYATYASTRGKALPPQQGIPLPPIDLDPPLQIEFRRLLNPYFSRSRLATHTDAIRDICARAIEPWLGTGSCDLSADYANKITVEVLALVILGLDDVAEVQQAQRLVEEIGGANALQAWQSLETLVDRLLQQRAGHPDGPDDVLTAILTGTVAGRPLTDDERHGTVAILLLGGLDTTKGALGNILFHVTRRPGLEQRLRDPGWVRSDLDEFLRLDTPVTAIARYVTRDTQLGGSSAAVPVRMTGPARDRVGAARRRHWSVGGAPNRFRTTWTPDAGRRILALAGRPLRRVGILNG